MAQRMLRALGAPTLLLAAATGCATLDSLGGALAGAPRPTADLVDVRLGSIGLEGAELLVDVDVANPYEIDLPLVELSYSLSSDELPFLNGTAELDGAVPARGSRVVSLPVALRYADVLAQLEGLEPGAVLAYTAAVALRVDAPAIGRVELPLTRRGELPVPAAPRVTLEGVEWSDPSLTSIGATLRIGVDNPNAFPLDLTRLGYALALDGVSVAEGRLAQPASLAAGGAARLEIPISVSPVRLGAAAMSLIRGESARYALSGTLEAATPFGPMALPYAREGTTPFL